MIHIHYVTHDDKPGAMDLKHLIVKEAVPHGLELAVRVYVDELALRATHAEDAIKHITDSTTVTRYSTEAKTLRAVAQTLKGILEDTHAS